ncbi:MAG: SDR family oxidoreductase [Candidatus Brocadiaceae bacterium]|nr:SDR family oxidoreductase [Candidatus Brocadiaceae bacterium]
MENSPDKLFRLDNRVVILTGGSGLIGSEAVRQLPMFGARVVVGVRDTDRFKDQLKDISLPEGCSLPVCYKLDISDHESVQSFFSKVASDFSKIDVLINNAFPRTKDWSALFEDVRPSSLYKNICDHAGGYFLCCQEAAFYMKKHNKGVILNVGSIYGNVGPHFSIYENTDMTSSSAYSLIKGGIHTFTKYLATYLAPHNIRVNCMSPGGIRDNGSQHPEFIKNYTKNTPLGRMAEPDDIIGPTIFLISDASKYVTGEVLMVDGGWTAW